MDILWWFAIQKYDFELFIKKKRIQKGHALGVVQIKKSHSRLK